MAAKRERSPDNDDTAAEHDEKRPRSHSTPTLAVAPEDAVTISLGENESDKLVVSWRELSRMCAYFRGFDGNYRPHRFHLVPRAEPNVSLLGE